jgi:hypothetical protein
MHEALGSNTSNATKTGGKERQEKGRGEGERTQSNVLGKTQDAQKSPSTFALGDRGFRK